MEAAVLVVVRGRGRGIKAKMHAKLWFPFVTFYIDSTIKLVQYNIKQDRGIIHPVIY